jgi:hypothetical protein
LNDLVRRNVAGARLEWLAPAKLEYTIDMGAERDWTYSEEQAWHKLAVSVPAEVCQRTGAGFDVDSAAYTLNVFNACVTIHPTRREIRGTGNLSDLLLARFSRYLCLPILWYLAHAQVVSPSDNFMNPRELAGGLIFSQGSHALPLDELAAEYGADTAAFLKKGTSLGGVHCHYGDASIKLYPFPKIPVLLILRSRNEEFPANAVLLLDTACRRYLPTDIIWAIAIVSVLVMF